MSSIDFSSLLTVTDADGDNLSLLQTGDFTVAVKDDIPVRVSNPTPIHAGVSEGGLSTAVDEAPTGAAGNDLSDGNLGAGETTTSDETSSTLAGSLAGLVLVGADEPPTFGFGTSTAGLPTLFSKGAAVSYALSDTDANGSNDTLTATATGRTVFTLHVSTDGTWTFDLDDQLDHVAGSGENFDLRTNAAGTTSVSSIDFSSLLTVTDADGDNLSLLQTGDFTVAVKDDIPVRVSNPTPIHAGVSEGGLSTAVDEAPTGAAGNDLSDGNLGAGETTTSDETSSTLAGSLAGLVLVGADEPPTFGFGTSTAGLPTLFSKGAAVSYALSDTMRTGRTTR